ncbi:MAG: Gfo/Idh/MocA family oxidoreductase [Chloroflexota bacterium]|nr:Gfo/Idh/MocA family oxidoreductase [Chloroflexota bacterium]
MDPVYMKAKEIIEEGHIGAVHYILGRTERNFVPLWGGPTFYEREGGGMLFDMGVYLISALTYLLGPAKKVAGMAEVSVPERPPKFSDDVFTDFLKGYQRGDNPTAYMRQREGTVPAVMEAPDNTFTLIEWPDDCLGCVIANSVSFVLPPPPAPGCSCVGRRGRLPSAYPAQDRGYRLPPSTRRVHIMSFLHEEIAASAGTTSPVTPFRPGAIQQVQPDTCMIAS